VWHPVAYYLKKHTPGECNYDINDKELMAMIKAPDVLWPECEGAAYLLLVITDHMNHEYFMTMKVLNRIQERWSEFSTRFDCQLAYRPGKSIRNAHGLSSRPGHLPQGGCIVTHNGTCRIETAEFNDKVANVGG
jgi:hypothetical protein